MKRLLLSLFLVIGLAGPVHAAGMNMLGSGSTAMRMMEAMWDMMEWFFNQRDANQNGVPWNYRYPASPWTYSYPTNPWNRNFANPWSYAQGPNAPGGMPGAGPWSGKGPGTTPFDNLTLWSPLDGIWRVSTGEYWIVQGNQFALYGGGNRAMRGSVSVQGNHLLAMIPATGTTYDFRFWLVDDMLVLRDEFGNAVVLDLLQPAAGNWQW